MGRHATPPELDLGRTMRLLGRGLRLRCPACGGGKMFDQWIVIRKRCLNCGLRFDRGEPDYFIGGYIVNLVVAELGVVAALLLTLYMTWPAVPWDLLTTLLLPVAILFPLVSYPFSKSLWLAIDLIYQPPVVKDFDEDHGLPAT